MARILGFLLILFLVFGCEEDSKKKIDVSNIDVNFKIDRFEKKFYNTSESDFIDLKKSYSFMLSNASDSIWIEKIKDEEEIYLFNESEKIFPNFDVEKKKITSLFKHIKYYNPKFNEPNIITHISNLDFEYPIIYADSLLFISLDMYLGKDNIVYSDFPEYIKENYEKENIVVDIAKDIIDRSYPKFYSRTFLDKIINEGKKMYLIDLYLPEVSDYLKIGYSSEKMNWAVINEINIWKYFIEHELLYSTDSNLNSRFIDVAPFSKFYQETDQDSPGRIGVWIGWHIVRSYMKNNHVTLQQLLTTPAEEIFKKSKYKPKK
ncbi:gliding motility lipoprotein GldB [Urechidicola croceus]|uniref:Gliding motility lipoprotein GldB n=1 Tax=Urechidicola croceus TaxID=1850246 RepID=A0A1D8P7S7_9FLAO|nr:gliding motility lipoprotein GldB [Urechidicola croceus]AOW20628.1 gliding motility lipoprotein GldB [Urechidicola croceus]